MTASQAVESLAGRRRTNLLRPGMVLPLSSAPFAPPTRPMQVTAVLNPIKPQAGEARSELQAACAEADWPEPEIVETTIDRPGGSQAQEAVADGAELVLYRIIQEALTNVARHAGAAAVATVTLRWRDTGVSVTVDDDGAGSTETDNAGQGLVGMRERTTLYDGTFSAGPKAAGGFRVHAQLPYQTT